MFVLRIHARKRESEFIMAPDLNMIIDTVDENNRPIGTTVRKDVLADNENFRTVHILLFDPNRNLLLQKLPEDHPRNPSKLGSSVAGYLKAGETYNNAARRKLLSELYLKTPLRFCTELEMKDEESTKFVAVFVGKFESVPSFDKHEIGSLETLHIDKVRRLLTDPKKASLFTPTFIQVFKAYDAESS